jgi:hypothetical protein
MQVLKYLFKYKLLIKLITFIVRLMHLILQILEVKIYVVQNFKKHNNSNLLQHVSDLMWSIIREYGAVFDWNSTYCFTDICRVRMGSHPHRIHTHYRFQNYAAKHRPSTRQISVKQYVEFQTSTAPYSLMMDHIRSETCRSKFELLCFLFKVLHNIDFKL